ncbi:biotin--acetyl-CoA-carboxylase, putative [Plasmodium berghei]|uniref:Biotin--protein ligase 1 n=2 Tax=Plasmodium berghei TaxID=5821 RepID=A0A509AH08_PLABA|nr:biotin--protein ligase 1 [Plasmodium berghei ANKA]CXI09674.1 biotin--acetyl-CoA-carboxylase, putative [Plasmodium berghei]SCL92883.1 biotin--acetyl-CoA-carboxylase, putative [Plasmodium berghei]SCM15745.1 biotin--acetyl-CoA-carboxylase, putative [Plasmodium berghei]SCM17540.1 biotin--acetyl-CoA-carboxylase, putative [Plasmodium berghei]SCN22964.1 biotin--acetyl-CoA-carboxylase, putative [Plasmodium berghei]|eukprot:XP_034420351.1 biotin--protein ligase 1 [Plasmodium berghei ANKA]
MEKENAIQYDRFYEKFNARHLHFDELDSTQLYCKRNMKMFIENGELKNDKNMIIVSCNSQTNGIGTRDTKNKMDRVWVSENGNVFVSIINLWKIEHIEKINCLSQACTVAISKTLEDFHLLTQIKWINDVLVDYKKISGCLVNLCYLNGFPDLEKNYVCVIVGIGINVNLTGNNNILSNNYTSIKKQLEQDFNASSLVPSVEQVIQKLINHFFISINKLRDENFSYFLEYITIRLLYKGEKVIIDQDNHQIVGYLKGILHDGSIILLNDHNQIIYANTGHLSLYKES